MFKALSDWFQQNLQQSDQVSEQQTIELATAVLLFEIMRADGEFAESEQHTYQQILRTHFNLSDSELESLMKLSSDHAKQAVDYHQFTRTINQHCDMQEKRQILESLWRVAYADRHLDVHEINLIRRISDLLHIPHSEFIQSKLKVTDNAD
ncbi:MAG: TerB family tellurite resistance protein [Aliiglaciecola sp.]|uniref:tellurite resistance TerB family protein n=1 Tax=Aliiglaciecola sp. TaxID=1872441 RepID=UPI003297364C